MNYVYHGSTKQNLTEIKPKKNDLIYATKDKIICALFIRNTKTGHGSFSRSFGHEKNIPFVVERYKNALEDMYDEVSGSIYILDSQSFFEDKLKWQMVSQKPVQVIEEIKIDNVKNFLIDLEKQKLLKIYRYPEKPKCIPADDTDLVKEVLKFNSLKKLYEFKQLFPDLYLEHKDALHNIIKQWCSRFAHAPQPMNFC